MKLQLATLALILAYFSYLPACKKKENPKSESLGYAGKMAGKHLWRGIEHEAVYDSSGNFVRDSNGNIVTISHEVVQSDSIIAFSSTKIAFTNTRYAYSGKVYDTLEQSGQNEVENTISFGNSSNGFASGHYWTIKQELKYNYVKDTFVLRVSYYGMSGFYDSSHVYYYSP